MQLGLQQFYPELPNEDPRGQISKDKVKQINEDFLQFKNAIEQRRKYIESKKAEKEALEAEFRKSLEREKREEHRAEIR